MPNWCQNTLRVEGREADVCEWIEQAASFEHSDLPPQPLFLEAFVAPPKRFRGSDEDLLARRYMNWGTKWEPRILDVRRSPGKVLYRFHTAWSPPLEWLGIVARGHPHLDFGLQYSEPGMNFAGEIVFQGGRVVFEQEETFEEAYA